MQSSLLLVHFPLYLCRYGDWWQKDRFCGTTRTQIIFCKVWKLRHHLYINGCNYFVNIFIAFLDCMDVIFMDLVRNEHVNVMANKCKEY